MSEVKGRLKVVNETFVVNEKFKKREFVITTGDTYPQDVVFQLVQDNCSKLDNYSVGQEIDIFYNLRGREWTSPQGEVKYFNTLEAWRIESGQGSAPPPIPTISKVDLLETTEDDLPF